MYMNGGGYVDKRVDSSDSMWMAGVQIAITPISQTMSLPRTIHPPSMLPIVQWENLPDLSTDFPSYLGFPLRWQQGDANNARTAIDMFIAFTVLRLSRTVINYTQTLS